MHAEGVVMTLPMPGHPLLLRPAARAAAFGNTPANADIDPDSDPVGSLDALIQQHDCVFSLLDSREGRWLPTVLCRAHEKLIITSALGFDSYLVMHHGDYASHHLNAGTAAGGAAAAAGTAGSGSSSAGCYFCSDIVGARNSQQDRSLDQQCTVTRPGLSFVAAGLAVELMVALLQQASVRKASLAAMQISTRQQQQLEHGQEGGEKREQEQEQEQEAAVPHQLRGNLHSFQQICPRIAPFRNCIACSTPVLHACLQDKRAFVTAVCGSLSGKLLEDVSGITAMTQDLRVGDFCCDSDSDSDSR